MARQSHQQELLSNALGCLLAAQEPADLVRQVSRDFSTYLGLDVYFNYMVEPDGAHLALLACGGIPEDDRPKLSRLAFGEAFCGDCAATRQPVIAFDLHASNDPRARFACAYGLRAYVCHPLMIGERLLGTLAFGSRTRSSLDRDEVEILRILCHYVSIAMDRARQEQAIRESETLLKGWALELESRIDARTRDLRVSQEQLRALTKELGLAEQRERKRLAGELHDYLAQLLVLGKLKLGQGQQLAGSLPACAEVIKQADALLADALNYTRTLVAELSPSVLHEFGLIPALYWLGERMKRFDLDVIVREDSPRECRLPEEHAVLLFQCVRELLVNVHKHAACRAATVTVRPDRNRLVVEICDEGRGFDMAAVDQQRLSSRDVTNFGLLSIRERMKSLGGEFDIRSAPDSGTTATLTIPVSYMEERHVRFVETPDGGTSDRREAEGGNTDSYQGTQSAALHPPSSPRIRVLLVDDHAMVRQGLRSLLEGYDRIDIVGEACNGDEAVAVAERRRPSVVIMDISMPGMNGIEATRRIKARAPEVAVIGLSVNATGENQHAMKSAGASLLLNKEAAVDQLFAAIQTTVGGNAKLSGS
ncbi:hypothetical protein YTPLAS18_15650 [Nitrospira sp.]|nr:hypothetical protein YTPLAS18_15650 [Nitrospira sp.]